MEASEQITKLFAQKEAQLEKQLENEREHVANLAVLEKKMLDCGDAFDMEDVGWVTEAKQWREKMVSDISRQIQHQNQQKEKYQNTFSTMRRTLDLRRGVLEKADHFVLENHPELTKRLAQKQLSLVGLYEKQLKAATFPQESLQGFTALI